MPDPISRKIAFDRIVAQPTIYGTQGFGRGEARASEPNIPMRIGAALKPWVRRVSDIFPEDNPYGTALERIIIGNAKEDTERLARGEPDVYTTRRGTPKPGPFLDLLGVLPVGAAAKVFKALPFLAGGVMASKFFSPPGQGTLGAAIMGMPPVGLTKTVKESKLSQRSVRPKPGESLVRTDPDLLKTFGTNLEGKPLYYKGDQWQSGGKDIGESIVGGATITIDPTVAGVRSATMSVGEQVTDPGGIRKLLKPVAAGNKISINLRKGALPEGRPVISVDTIPRKGGKSTHFYALKVEMGGETYLRKVQKGGNPRMFADQYGDIYIDPSKDNIATYIPYRGKGVPTQSNIKKVGEQYLIPVYKQLYTSGQKLAN